MSAETIATVVTLLESLPDPVQEQVVEHLREYLLDIRDEAQWDTLFQRSHPKLTEAARQAKQEIAEGKAEPMNYDQL